MIVFEDRDKLLEFFKDVTKGLEKLHDSGFEVNLSIIPIDRDNLEVVINTFNDYQKKQDRMVQPVNGRIVSK